MTEQPKDHQQLARNVLDQIGAGDENQPAEGVEKAWAEWSSQIHNVDERGMTLLRAAFEAGFEIGQSCSAAELGSRGGQRGGPARAAKLTAQERSEIAKKAAAARWKKDS